MDGVAQLDPEERGQLFEQVAARMGVLPIVAEKDFWVCWILQRLFSLPGDRPSLLFKGGTSLSKAFGLIKRFSEDIDLSVSRQDLGFSGTRDPAEVTTRKARNSLLEDLGRECHEYIKHGLTPALHDSIAEVLSDSGWSLEIDEDNPGVVSFAYPKPSDPGAYIKPIVRLELGARSDHWPASDRAIRPYAADEFSDFFSDPECIVRVLDVTRTFWEKATILHSLYHGGAAKAIRGRLSRHYYDVVMIARSAHRKEILESLELLTEVAIHKSKFFYSAWARYDEARPGTLKLAPSDELTEIMAKEYLGMREMIFTEPPDFGDLLQELQELEEEINSAT